MCDPLPGEGQPASAVASPSAGAGPVTITLDQYFDVLKAAHGGALPLNDEQKKAIEHDFATPLWMIAGPGTGKTHTLVWLVLKRMLVDGAPPERVFMTTFTRKAAAELESRLTLSRQKLMAAGLHQAEACDVSRVHLGTLHALCAQVLEDNKYEPALHIRVLADELTQQFFVRRTRNRLVSCDDLGFWNRLGALRKGAKFPPATAQRTAAACMVFNRVTENMIEPDELEASDDPHFQLLATAYREYEAALKKEHRTDQAHLQRHLLDFLATPEGRSWLGDGFTVVVDEYQDTNPIQESLYFELAGRRGDVAVVGDDDQSLYRFRGATVESLIDFDRACEAYLGKAPKVVYLHENRRSHPLIVAWVNRFMSRHPDMRDDKIRVRAPNKPTLVASAPIDGDYPAVMGIIEDTNAAAAQKVAEVVRSLKDERLITDYSQVALLAYSVRESSTGIGAYTEALREAGIPIYNPRNRTAHKDRRFRALLGAISSILDPEFDVESLHARLPGGVQPYLEEAREAYTELVASGRYHELEAYVAESVKAIRWQGLDATKTVNFLQRSGGRRVTLNGLFYKLLGHEPFASDLTDAEGGERMKALNQILAEYESLYDDGEIRLSKDEATGTARVNRWALYNFYAVFVEGIHDGLNDPEDDEISILPGAVNVMTIHQAKGLEFEVVFVLRPDNQPSVGQTHLLEDLLDPFIHRPTKPARRSQELRAAEDAVRLFFVAYSRAKRLLVLAGTNVNKWDRALGVDGDGAKLNSVAALEKMGAHRV